MATKTLAQLKNCDMGSWFNAANPDRARPEYVGQTIPTLEEVFQRYGTTANYYIETKTLGTSAQMEPELLRLLVRYGLRDGAVTKHSVLVQSFDAQSLSACALDAEIPLVLLGAATTAQFSAATYAFGIGPLRQRHQDAPRHGAHFISRCILIRSTSRADSIGWRACVDGMFTNFPDRYRTIIDAGNLGCRRLSADVCSRGRNASSSKAFCCDQRHDGRDAEPALEQSQRGARSSVIRRAKWNRFPPGAMSSSRRGTISNRPADQGSNSP